MSFVGYQCISFDLNANGVLYVTINHPPINLLDAKLVGELNLAADEIAANADVRVMVLQSAIPEFFVAHSDLARVGVAPPGDPLPTADQRATQEVAGKFSSMPKATIAKIAGRARGGGSELALGCDMRFAAIGRARLGQPEVGVGIIPGGGGTQRLPRLIGRGRALEVILGCDDLTAEVAQRYGYVNRAVPADEIDAFVDNLATRIAAFPPHAVARAKLAVDKGSAQGLNDGLWIEAEEFAACLARPATSQRVSAALNQGVQTFDGELRLPDLICDLPLSTST